MLKTSLVLFAVLLISGAARADCSNGTIRGDYSFTVHGQSLSADGPTITGLIDGVGTISFDGSGNATQEGFIIKSGSQVPGGPRNPSGFHTGETGTNSINSDCTGTAVITLNEGNTRTLAPAISRAGLAIPCHCLGRYRRRVTGDSTGL